MLRQFYLKKVSPEVAMLPMVTDRLKMLESFMVNPSINIEEAYNTDFISIKKREGFIKRLKGTMGYNIKDSLAE